MSPGLRASSALSGLTLPQRKVWPEGGSRCPVLTHSRPGEARVHKPPRAPDSRRLLVQPGAGRTFQTCHCWVTLTRKLYLPGLWQTSPNHTTTQSSPSREEAPYSALHKHSQTQPDVCLAMPATEALVDRTGNRPVGRWMANSRWCDPSGTRAQRICTGPRVSSRWVSRARVEGRKSRGVLSGDQGDRGPVSRAQALTPVTTARVPGTSLRLAIHGAAAVRILRQCSVSPRFGHL